MIKIENYKPEILKLMEAIYLGKFSGCLAFARILAEKAKSAGDDTFAEAIDNRLNGRFRPYSPISLSITTNVENESRSFQITSVHRDDIKKAMVLTDKQVSKITDEMMEQIASKMSNDYCEQLFWDHLPPITKKVLEGYGIDLND